MARILQVFLDSDLRCGHEGLEAVAKKHKIAVKDLDPGQYVVFVNSARDRIKIFAASHVIAYLKAPVGKIDMRTISLIPQAFEGKGRFNYDEALKELIKKKLPNIVPK